MDILFMDHYGSFSYDYLEQKLYRCFLSVSRLDPYLCISILECLLAALLCAITFNLINVDFMKVSRFFRMRTPEEKELQDLNAEIAKVMEVMAPLSPVSDFAKYFKNERVLNRLRERHDKLNGAVAQKSLVHSMKFAVALRGLLVTLMVVLVWHSSTYNQLVVAHVDESVFYPFNFLLSPFAVLSLLGADNPQNGGEVEVTLFNFLLLGLIVLRTIKTQRRVKYKTA